MIKTVSTLEELNLEDNEIGEEGATAIALGIQCETAKLKSLNISQNIIGDNGGIGTYLKCMPNGHFWPFLDIMRSPRGHFEMTESNL